jgi:hypothetical protein
MTSVSDNYGPEHEIFSVLLHRFQGTSVYPMQPANVCPIALHSAELALICYDFDARSKRMSRTRCRRMDANAGFGDPYFVYGRRDCP